MLKSRKNVFWEALFVTVLIFTAGILLGISFEKERFDEVEKYYAQSEVSLTDMMVLQKLSDLRNTNCEVLIDANMDFANKIYEEAVLLEDYEQANQITDNLKLSHKKYDLLRTFLWANVLTIFEKCERDFTPIIYLYEYNTEDLDVKAQQNVWSNILFDLKQSHDDIILLPIAVDNELSSVDAMINQYRIRSFPAVMVGDVVFYNVTSLETIEDTFSKS